MLEKDNRKILLHTSYWYYFDCLSSSIGGVILDKTVLDPNLAGIIVYAPVINGELFSLFVFLYLRS